MTKFHVLLSLNIITYTIVNCYDKEPTTKYNCNWGKIPNYNYATNIRIAPVIILSITISLKDNKFCAKSCAAKAHNKNLHLKYGNQIVNKF